MNAKRIAEGGLLAGLVLLVSEILLHVTIVSRYADPSLFLGGMPIGVFVLRSAFLGMGTVLVYALIRPRLGAGVKSAASAGIVVFLIGVLFPPFGLATAGIFPSAAMLNAIIWSAVELPLAAVAGAWVYREETAASTVDALASAHR